MAVRHFHKQQQEGKVAKWGSQIHSFCIGLKGSPDLKAAKEVADFLGTIHHSFTFTIQEGLDAISDVIYHLETFDTTTIRAATPMFLMARKIKALGVKMVLVVKVLMKQWLHFSIKLPTKSSYTRKLLEAEGLAFV